MHSTPVEPRRRRSLLMLGAIGLALAGATLAVAGQRDEIDRLTPPSLTISYSPAEQALFADAADGSFDAHTLLTAALIASGVREPVALDRHQRRFDGWVGELRESGEVAGSPRQQAQAVFAFLHRRILRGEYRTTCTDLTETFRVGDYNCVSATVLFNALCEQFQLATSAVEGPGHAVSRLQLGHESLDVETTCPEWFSVLDDPSASRAARAHPPVTRPLSPVALVAEIYYNRGVDLIERHEFARAIAANAKTLRLDPDNATAQGNLLAALNNWALDLSGREQFEAAERLLRHGRVVAPYYQTFQANLLAVRHRWIDELRTSGRATEADAVASRAAAEPLVRESRKSKAPKAETKP